MSSEMNNEFEKWEQALACQMRLLRLLPAERPSEACVARVRAAIRVEFGRRRRQWGLPTRSVMLGAAAALALVVGWSTGPVADWLEVDASLRDWAAALDDSNARLVSTLHEGSTGTHMNGDLEIELDDLLQSLDESLARFRNL